VSGNPCLKEPDASAVHRSLEIPNDERAELGLWSAETSLRFSCTRRNARACFPVEWVHGMVGVKEKRCRATAVHKGKVLNWFPLRPRLSVSAFISPSPRSLILELHTVLRRNSMPGLQLCWICCGHENAKERRRGDAEGGTEMESMEWTSLMSAL
jgi:hypothetical protein